MMVARKDDTKLFGLLILCLILLPLLTAGCQDSIPSREGKEKGDREQAAQEEYLKIQKEFTERDAEIREGIRLGEKDSQELYDLDHEFRIRLDEFVESYSGTNTAAGVQVKFALVDIELGEFESAEARLDEIISTVTRGDNLALALMQKSVFESDRDLEKALEIINRAERVDGIKEGTLTEVKLHRLNLLEMLKRDREFEALYLELTKSDVGPYLGALTLVRLKNFIRLGKLGSVEGLIDSVKDKLDENTLLLLKGQYAASKLVGQKAPPIKGTDLSGAEFNLPDHKGEAVIVIFFTMSSTPLLRQIDTINKLYEDKDNPNLEIIGVNIDPDTEMLSGFASEHNILWPIISDPDVTIQKSYYVMSEPALFIIDSEGNVVFQGIEICQLKYLFADV